MKTRLLPLVGLAAILALVQANSITQGETSRSPMQSDDFCGTEHEPASIGAHEKAFSKRKLDSSIIRAQPEESVNVHFHIITDGDTGNIDDFTIDEQMRVRPHLEPDLVPRLRQFRGGEKNEGRASPGNGNRPEYLYV